MHKPKSGLPPHLRSLALPTRRVHGRVPGMASFERRLTNEEPSYDVLSAIYLVGGSPSFLLVIVRVVVVLSNHLFIWLRIEFAAGPGV
jgi:hypothetical protein